MKKKTCFCASECINGSCPNALDDLDRRSDTDAYSCYVVVKCFEGV